MFRSRQEWENLEKQNYDFLDTIDFSKYLNSRQDVNQIMNSIEEDYYSSKKQIPDVLEGEIFNFIDDYSFAYYLAKRYNLKVYEEVNVKYFIY